MDHDKDKSISNGIEDGNKVVDKSAAQELDERIEQPNEFEDLPTPKGGGTSANATDQQVNESEDAVAGEAEKDTQQPANLNSSEEAVKNDANPSEETDENDVASEKTDESGDSEKG